MNIVIQIRQGICGNPWPMLNAVVQSLGHYEDPVKECSKNGLSRDPDNCSGFYSCVKGTTPTSINLKATNVSEGFISWILIYWLTCVLGLFFIVVGLLHHGHCGHGRFFDPIEKRCVTAAPEICKLNVLDRVVEQNNSALAPATSSQAQKLDKLELLQQKGPRIVCYVASWALYRKGDAKFVPENLNSHLCTDIIYAFAGLSPETLMVQTFDPWADIDNSESDYIDSFWLLK